MSYPQMNDVSANKFKMKVLRAAKKFRVKCLKDPNNMAGLKK